MERRKKGTKMRQRFAPIPPFFPTGRTIRSSLKQTPDLPESKVEKLDNYFAADRGLVAQASG
jgi:hypothetical protein